MFNLDLRGYQRGKCSCGQCEEFLLRNKDVKYNGWCEYCNHPPVQHELVTAQESTTVQMITLPSANSEHKDLGIPGPSNTSFDHETEPEFLEHEVCPLEEENIDDSPKKSCASKKIPLPVFSKVLQPLLEGEALSLKDHAQLSSIMKTELIAFLNQKNLICGGNSSSLRWEYRNLGEALASKYPKMLWDLPSQRQKKSHRENSPIYAVFIRRLSQRRKMQRLREKGKEKRIVEVDEEITFEVSAEDAVSELNSVTSETVKSGVNTERINKLLKISFKIRSQDDISELPPFLMAQTHIETEIELRFMQTMSEMQEKLKKALIKMSAEYLVPPTIYEMEKLMQPKRVDWSALTTSEYNEEKKLPGPSIFFGVHKVITTGIQVIKLKETCSPEKAAILLLGIYYILNLNFPAAYGQFLGSSANNDSRKELEHLLRKKFPHSSVEVWHLDLGSLKSVEAFAERYIASGMPLHLLINNAGIMFVKEEITEDGFEKHFAVNYLSHCLLTLLLLPLLCRSGLKEKKCRIINCTSCIHYIGKMDLKNLPKRKCYSKYRAYIESKLAQVMFTYSLQSYLHSQEANVTVNSVHPGVVNTELMAKELIFPNVGSIFFKTAKEGAETATFVALSPEMEGIGGKYLEECMPVISSKVSNNVHLQTELWKQTLSLLKPWLKESTLLFS